MSKYTEFDPEEIEEDIYMRLSEEKREQLCRPEVIREMNAIRMKRAGKILEDEDINILNFQMF